MKHSQINPTKVGGFQRMEKNKERNRYYNNKKYDILENKSMIHVFKKTFWNKHLKYWKGFAKEYYKWKEDDEGEIYIITEKKEVKPNSSHD